MAFHLLINIMRIKAFLITIPFILSAFISNAQMKGYANPAAVYCEKMGYSYNTQEDINGDHNGVCILPNDSVVDAWDFYRGKVAQEYSYCEKMGYKTEYLKTDSNGVVSECAVCVQEIAKGRETRLKMTDLMDQKGESLITIPVKKSANLLYENAKPAGSLNEAASMPSAFSWRRYNGHRYIGRIRDQGSCGACYAFGAIASAEVTYNVANGYYDDNCIDLSESFIIWCLGNLSNYNSHFSGCDGADYSYMELQALCDSGACYESSFPYTESETSCTHWNDERVKMNSWYRIDCSDTTAIKTAIMTYGAVDAAVNVKSAFQNYTSGIYTDAQTACTASPCYETATNHGVALVGWGHDDTYGLYWILRNSWGTSWGERGYMRIQWNAARVACEVCYMDYKAPDLDDPSKLSAMPVSSSEIDLTWKSNLKNDVVLIAWSPDGTFGTPTNRVTYSAGDTIPGGGTTLYCGNSCKVNHTSLSPSTTYYYKAWSNTFLNYSTGITQHATTFCNPITSFPYSEDFISGIQPNCWTQHDSIGNGQLWLFGTTTESINPNLTGNYAYLNSDNYGNGNSQNADLISPVFDFSKYKNIVLGFNHYFQYFKPSKTALLYSVDNGATWTTLQTWTASTTNPAVFSRDLTSEISGYSQVLFKWNYTGTYAWYWAIDDISLTADLMVPVTYPLANITISDDESRCFNATDTIYIAGDGNTVEFLNGSNVDMIAGKSIHFLPGFHAYEGSYLYAWITDEEAYCNSMLSSDMISATTEKSETQIEDQLVQKEEGALEKGVKIYPNPNDGTFTVELSNFEGASSIAITNMMGILIYHSTITGDNVLKPELSGLPNGIYFVTVRNGETVKTNKMIIQ